MRVSDDLQPVILDDTQYDGPGYGHPDVAPMTDQSAAVLKSARRAFGVGVASLALGLLSLGATVAVELGYINLKDSAEATLTSRLGEISSELVRLQAAIDAGAVALSDQRQRTQQASEQIASLAQRLELSQAQIAQKLGALSRQGEARQEVTVPTAMPAVPKGPAPATRRTSKPTGTATSDPPPSPGN